MEQELKDFKPNKIVIGSSVGQFDRYSYYKMLISNNATQFVPHFYITKEGEIQNLIPINTYSKYTSFCLIDEESISIELENIGSLKLNKNNEFIDIFDNIYNSTDNIINEYFRGGKYWDGYTESQLRTLTNLVLKLCNEYKINNNINEVLNQIPINDNGIIFRSNISILFNDPHKHILTWKITQDKY